MDIRFLLIGDKRLLDFKKGRNREIYTNDLLEIDPQSAASRLKAPLMSSQGALEVILGSQ